MSSYEPEPLYRESQEPSIIPSTETERTWAMLCHLTGFLGYSVLPGIGWFLGPLVVWLLKKDQMPLVDDQGKESLNFQISVLIYGVICIPLLFVLVGIPLLIALAVFQIVAMILAAVKANQGIRYRYPLTIRFLR